MSNPCEQLLTCYSKTMHTSTNKTKIIVICGPTAVGKTSAAIDLARIFNGEIISADSRQIYRYMNIGTAKPEPKQLAEIPHYMVDCIDPDQHFDARQFAWMAHKIILKLSRKKQLPFIVGGTGLYIKALLNGLFEDNYSDSSVRGRLKKEADTGGKKILYEKLKKIDPETANKLHPNDTYRIVRALEVFEISGKPISKWHQEHQFSDTRYFVFKVGLYLDREILYKQIDRRVDIMISAGLIEEVQAIIKRGYSPDLKSMKAIGYSHIIDYLMGDCSLEEAVKNLKRDTRRYSKRQMTWFRADPEINWIKPSEINTIIPLMNKFLEKKL
jgi:tRNA dimethylallyltransferase